MNSRGRRRQLSPGRQQLLDGASPDGFVFAANKSWVDLAERMVAEGLLKHHRGLIYEVTQRGLAQSR